jgi:hypothetical protein
MEVLKLASCMAENTEVFCQALAIYVQRQLGIRTQYVGGRNRSKGFAGVKFTINDVLFCQA